MDIWEAMEKRHSVRKYTDKPVEDATAAELSAFIAQYNEASGLHMQLCLDEPGAFSGRMARYGSFVNVRNYIAIVGDKHMENLDDACGYYGEKVVLKATQLGLSTCWVAMTYSKGRAACKVEKGEKLCIVIAVGYGATEGVPHKNRPMEHLCQFDGDMPDWFRRGMEAAMLAPTATNQQKFLLTLRDDGTVKAQALSGFYTKIDLGIVKCHFEYGAGTDGWKWG